MLLALEDGGGVLNGVRNDDNHDDLAVVLRIGNGSLQVPEPSSLSLPGAGLLRVGFAAGSPQPRLTLASPKRPWP